MLDAAVVAWPSQEFGEEIGAFVVAREGGIKPDDLMAWCRQSLSRYKLPREIFVIDELPKSGVGKVLKKRAGRYAQAHRLENHAFVKRF